jgi:hypothetical protein
VPRGARRTVPDVALDYVSNQQMHRFIFRNAVTSEDKAGAFSAFPKQAGIAAAALGEPTWVRTSWKNSFRPFKA